MNCLATDGGSHDGATGTRPLSGVSGFPELDGGRIVDDGRPPCGLKPKRYLPGRAVSEGDCPAEVAKAARRTVAVRGDAAEPRASLASLR